MRCCLSALLLRLRRLPWCRFSILAVGMVLAGAVQVAARDIIVTVDRTTTAGTSQYYSSFSQVDNSLDYPWTGNNGAAVTNARALMAQGIRFVNNPIMAWGVADPWPDPTTTNPTNWSVMDTQMRNIINAGCTPIITLCEAPWWMKGYCESDGSTTLIPNLNGEWYSFTNASAYTDFRGIQYPPGYVSADPYGSRILDSQMTHWLLLVQRVAERYMPAPYNVRYFQVWNELKGYYNPVLNAWDYQNVPGNTNGYNAQHGYCYMYNQVYQRLTNVAGALGIAATNVYIGGPYTVMDSGSSSTGMSNPSRVSGPWGVLDQRELDVLSYWLTNRAGAGFVCVDGGNDNRFGNTSADPFTLCDKFAAVNNWVRQQPGGATLPLVWAEWYCNSGVEGDDALDNALGSYAAIQQVKSGAMLTLLWGAQYSSVARPPLWTSTSEVGGGQATAWYYTCAALNASFGHGVTCCPTTSTSSNIAVLATQIKTLLVNRTTNTMAVSLYATNLVLGLDSTNLTLGRYGVAILDAAPLSRVESLTLTNTKAVVMCAGMPGYSYQVQRGTNALFRGTLRLWNTNAPASGSFGVTDDFSDLVGPPFNAFYRGCATHF